MNIPECYHCGILTDSELARSPMPKELLGKNDNGDIVEDLKPFCRKCYYIQRAADLNFINLCNDAKFFEWYRATSRKRSEYFMPELVYNVDVEVLREIYLRLVELCFLADKVASDDTRRQEIIDNLNYVWRKRDV
jgi:hypothetical protein